MINIIGQENCSRCQMVKSLFESKKIPYEYQLMSTLSDIEQTRIAEEASMRGLLNFPLIVDDGRLVPLSEVM